jgi:hypothetical protein
MAIHNRFQTTDWQFTEDPTTLVLTSRQVVDDHAPVLVAARDADGGWSFMSGQEGSMADVRFVTLDAVLIIDPTLHEVAKLAAGEKARRALKGEEWVMG